MVRGDAASGPSGFIVMDIVGKMSAQLLVLQFFYKAVGLGIKLLPVDQVNEVFGT